MTDQRAQVGTVVTRPYLDEDEPRVIELLQATLGGGPAGERTPEFFRWKHLENPFGRSYMLVAETGGRIVGLRAFLRWRFLAGDRVVHAVRAVDTATHPDHQGQGIFSKLTLQALDELRKSVDLVFNTPNPNSLRGYLKMGWQQVGEVPVAIRVRRPIRFLRGVRSIRDFTVVPSERPLVRAAPAMEALIDDRAVARLLDGAETPDERLRTPRDVEYLRWRYGSTASSLDYRAVSVREAEDLRGIAFFRVRPRGRLWETTLADVIVREGDRAAASALLRRVARAAPVDHVACRLPEGSAAARAAARWGAVRSPQGITFVVNPLRDELQPDPTELGSWRLCLGDLEVF